MSTSKGYFSIVQYCPDAARQEAANIGVVLFCADHEFFQARTCKSIGRIHRFFGEGVDGPGHLNGMIEAFCHRVENERPFCKTLEDLTRFVNTLANKVVLSQPKQISVTYPVVDLKALYKELVAQPQ
jgi:hypothetical protein